MCFLLFICEAVLWQETQSDRLLPYLLKRVFRKLMISSFSTNSFSWSAASSSPDFAAAAGLGGMVYHQTRISRFCSQIPRGYVLEYLISEYRMRGLAQHAYCDRLDVISGLPGDCRAPTLQACLHDRSTRSKHSGNLNRVGGCIALGFCSCCVTLDAEFTLPQPCRLWAACKLVQ